MKKGISLAELLAVIVIMGIIAGIAIPLVGSTIEKAREKAIYGDAYALQESARIFCSLNETNEFCVGTENEIDGSIRFQEKYLNIDLKSPTDDNKDEFLEYISSDFDEYTEVTINYCSPLSYYVELKDSKFYVGDGSLTGCEGIVLLNPSDKNLNDSIDSDGNIIGDVSLENGFNYIISKYIEGGSADTIFNNTIYEGIIDVTNNIGENGLIGTGYVNLKVPKATINISGSTIPDYLRVNSKKLNLNSVEHEWATQSNPTAYIDINNTIPGGDVTISDTDLYGMGITGAALNSLTINGGSLNNDGLIDGGINLQNSLINVASHIETIKFNGSIPIESPNSSYIYIQSSSLSKNITIDVSNTSSIIPIYIDNYEQNKAKVNIIGENYKIIN